MKRLALLGGTFNPVHNGHIRLIKAADKELSFDEIIIMPSSIPPHKQAVNLASGQDRLNMCRLAFSDMKNAQVSDYEINREGRSYSVITLRYLHEKYPDFRIYFIMGSDMLLSFEGWYCYKEILSLCTLVCVSRCGGDSGRLSDYAKKLESEGGEVIILPEEPLELSSTQLRDMIEHKKLTKLSCYLPENVVKYIMDNNLYND